MSKSVSTAGCRRLLRGVAIVSIAGIAAGCSNDVTRFSDRFYTGSIPTKAPPESVSNPVYEPYPGDVDDRRGRIDRTYTGSVARQAAKPVDLRKSSVQRSALPAAGTAPKSALAPVAAPHSAKSEPVDPVTTGTVADGKRASQLPDAGTMDGWTRTGGTQVSLRQGETIYNLSRRFGVPAKAIMDVNGIKDASKVHAGQRIIIPTYVYSSKTPVSAPDSNPNTAAAKSSRGTKFDVDEKKVPAPSKAPKKQVAVLPKATESRPAATRTKSSGATTNEGRTTTGTYTVASGDTLWGIARKHGVSVAALREKNGIAQTNIRVGQKLSIPSGNSGDAPAEKRTDSTHTASVAPKATSGGTKLPTYTPPRKTEKVIEKANLETTAATPSKTGVGTMRWPARGRVVSEYGERKGSKANDGIDIALPAGTPVKASENGIVIYAGDGLKDFGNTVLVRHEDGLVTVYGHNSAIKVSRGERVRRGQEIASSGMSGTADSPRLHFEVRKNSVPVNPVSYLE